MLLARWYKGRSIKKKKLENTAYNHLPITRFTLMWTRSRMQKSSQDWQPPWEKAKRLWQRRQKRRQRRTTRPTLDSSLGNFFLCTTIRLCSQGATSTEKIRTTLTPRFDRHCICSEPGQVPCPAVVPVPRYCLFCFWFFFYHALFAGTGEANGTTKATDGRKKTRKSQKCCFYKILWNCQYFQSLKK